MLAVTKVSTIFPIKKTSMYLYEKGYQMIEVLVALFILMIAVTSIGGIQIISLKSNRQNTNHISALGLVQDISDSMRANQKATQNERYATLFSQKIPKSQKKCINTSNTCTSLELVQAELGIWKQNIRETFFQGEGEITFFRVNDQLHANITIRWNDSGERLNNNEKTCMKDGGKLSCQTLLINFCDGHSSWQNCR